MTLCRKAQQLKSRPSSLPWSLPQDSDPTWRAPGGLGGQLLSFGATFWAKGSSVWILLANKIKGKMLGGKKITALCCYSCE